MASESRSGWPALVVEDEPLIAIAAAEALERLGADVRCCASTTEAMAALAGAIPEVMLLDCRLADRDDGWAIAELAQAVAPRLPLLIFATAQPEVIPDHIAELGHVLPKPYTAEALAQLVEQHRSAHGPLRRLFAGRASQRAC